MMAAKQLNLRTLERTYLNRQLKNGNGYYDKVIQFRNRPQSDSKYVYQDSEGKWVQEQKVLYNLELAYAISVHKL